MTKADCEEVDDTWAQKAIRRQDARYKIKFHLHLNRDAKPQFGTILSRGRTLRLEHEYGKQKEWKGAFCPTPGFPTLHDKLAYNVVH